MGCSSHRRRDVATKSPGLQLAVAVQVKPATAILHGGIVLPSSSSTMTRGFWEMFQHSSSMRVYHVLPLGGQANLWKLGDDHNLGCYVAAMPMTCSLPLHPGHTSTFLQDWEAMPLTGACDVPWSHDVGEWPWDQMGKPPEPHLVMDLN